MKKLAWNTINISGNKIFFTVNEKGINFVGTPKYGLSQVQDFYNEQFEYIFDSNITNSYKKELKEYLKGKRKYFDVNLDFSKAGTSFQHRVWEEISKVPYGEVITYSNLAKKMGLGYRGAHIISKAINKNPLLIIIPCHRVVRKDGRTIKFRGGEDLKNYLLTLESKNATKHLNKMSKIKISR